MGAKSRVGIGLSYRRGLSPNFYIHVSVSDLYIHRIRPHIFLQQNRQIDRGNMTDRHMNVEIDNCVFAVPLSWSVHYNLARDGYIESSCCCVQTKFLGMETKILFPFL